MIRIDDAIAVEVLGGEVQIVSILHDIAVGAAQLTMTMMTMMMMMIRMIVAGRVVAGFVEVAARDGLRCSGSRNRHGH